MSAHNMCVVTCIHSSNITVFNPDGSSTRACILLQKFNQEDVTIILAISILLYLLLLFYIFNIVCVKLMY